MAEIASKGMFANAQKCNLDEHMVSLRQCFSQSAAFKDRLVIIKPVQCVLQLQESARLQWAIVGVMKMSMTWWPWHFACMALDQQLQYCCPAPAWTSGHYTNVNGAGWQAASCSQTECSVNCWKWLSAGKLAAACWVQPGADLHGIMVPVSEVLGNIGAGAHDHCQCQPEPRTNHDAAKAVLCIGALQH
jgi:hypothetical protein